MSQFLRVKNSRMVQLGKSSSNSLINLQASLLTATPALCGLGQGSGIHFHLDSLNMAFGRKLQVHGSWQVSVFHCVDLAIGQFEYLHNMAAGLPGHAISKSKEEAIKRFMMQSQKLYMVPSAILEANHFCPTHTQKGN